MPPALITHSNIFKNLINTNTNILKSYYNTNTPLDTFY